MLLRRAEHSLDAPSCMGWRQGIGLAVATVDLPGGPTEALTDGGRGAGRPAPAPYRAGGQSEPLWGSVEGTMERSGFFWGEMENRTKPSCLRFLEPCLPR